MLIKADIPESGGTCPSVLLLNNNISIRGKAKDRDRWRDTVKRVQRKEGTGAHFNQRFGPLSCRVRACVCAHLREWHNFTDGFDPLSVVTCLASWAQSRDCCDAANCEHNF